MGKTTSSVSGTRSIKLLERGLSSGREAGRSLGRSVLGPWPTFPRGAPGEHNMEINCPKCGSNVAQILMGTGDSHYVMCLGCRESTLIQPPQTLALPPLNGFARRGRKV